MSIAARWRALPLAARIALGVVGVGGVVGAAYIAQRKVKAMSIDISLEHVDALKLGPRRTAAALAIFDELRGSGLLTPYEIACMMAAAYMEGGFNARARSPKDAPDEKAKGAWGTFQHTGDTLATLGMKPTDVTPQKGADGSDPTPAEWDRAARASARAALKLLFFGRWLQRIRARTEGDPVLLAREIFTAWNAGQSVPWSKIAGIAPSKKPGSYGYVHYTVAHKLEALPKFLAAMGLPDLPPYQPTV